MLKALIGLAAVAVIAFVGYFFWGEWQRADAEARDRAEATRLAREKQMADVAALAAIRRTLATRCVEMADEYRRAVRGENLGYRFVQAEARSALRKCVDEGLLAADAVADLKL